MLTLCDASLSEMAGFLFMPGIYDCAENRPPAVSREIFNQFSCSESHPDILTACKDRMQKSHNMIRKERPKPGAAETQKASAAFAFCLCCADPFCQQFPNILRFQVFEWISLMKRLLFSRLSLLLLVLASVSGGQLTFWKVMEMIIQVQKARV